MQLFRTLLWVVLTAFIAMFVAVNYGEKHDVIIWPLSNDALVYEWPVGIIALVFWLLGVVPTWIYHSGIKWSLNRRIRSLESAARSIALQKRPEPTSSDTTPAPNTPDPVEKADSQAEDVLSPATSDSPSSSSEKQ